MEQLAEQPDNGNELRCTICETALSSRTPASSCKHRVNSIHLAEFFWEEA